MYKRSLVIIGAVRSYVENVLVAGNYNLPTEGCVFPTVEIIGA